MVHEVSPDTNEATTTVDTELDSAEYLKAATFAGAAASFLLCAGVFNFLGAFNASTLLIAQIGFACGAVCCLTAVALTGVAIYCFGRSIHKKIEEVANKE